jgi:hypothetical protein
MAKKYKLEQSSLSSHERFLRLYETLLRDAPISNNPLDFTVQFRNGKFKLDNTIESAQVLRDWLVEAPHTRPIAPFEEHIYDVTKDGFQFVKRQRNIPGYVVENIRERYEKELWGGGPQWITTRAKSILPADFRNVVQNLRLPGWEIQDAEIIVKQNYRTRQKLRFGLNKKGVEIACFTENDHLEDWLKRVAKEYDTELIQEETEDGQIVIASELPDGNYVMMPQCIYAQGVQALREAHERGENLLDRPLTFGENLQARLQNAELFQTWMDSCTGIAYKAGTSRFKIIRECDPLINIDPEFNQVLMGINYDSLEEEEFDRNDATYNGLLTRDQVMKHPAWQAAVGDQSLLEEYTNHYFNTFNRETGMGFWLRDNIDIDQLRALCVDYVDYYSVADGINNLNNNYARFALVAPSGAP